MKVRYTASVVVTLAVEVLVDGRFRNKGHGRRHLRIRIMDFGGMMEVVKGRRMRSNGEQMDGARVVVEVEVLGESLFRHYPLI